MSPSNVEEGPAPRTVVIRSEPRGSTVRRLLLALLCLSVILNLVLFAGRAAGGAGRLDERYYAGDLLERRKIAVVEVSGLILGGEVDHVLAQIRRARDDFSVKGVVLRVDSPGGTVSGADRIWREVESLRARGKPVVASLGGTAASGGYYVASAAETIVAEPTTLTGSIGVKLELPEIGGLLEKLGVDIQVLTTGPWKDAGSIYRPLTDAERRRWRGLLEAAHERFVRVVARGRRLAPDEARAVSDGRLMTAEEAVDARLIDRIGYLDDAIVVVQGILGHESSRVIRYARPLSLADLVPGVGSTGGRAAPSLDADALLRLRSARLLYLAP